MILQRQATWEMSLLSLRVNVLPNYPRSVTMISRIHIGEESLECKFGYCTNPINITCKPVTLHKAYYIIIRVRSAFSLTASCVLLKYTHTDDVN